MRHLILFQLILKRQRILFHQLETRGAKLPPSIKQKEQRTFLCIPLPLLHTTSKIMITLKAVQPSIPTLHQSFPCRRNFANKDKDKSTLCFCSSNDDGSDSSPSSGDKRKQELLARIAMLQAQKVRLTNFLDERADYLSKFAEDANSQFDEIGQNALKELDEAGTRVCNSK